MFRQQLSELSGLVRESELTLAVIIPLGLPVVAEWFSGVAEYVPRLFAAALIVFGGLVGGRLLGDLIARAAPATVTNILASSQLQKTYRVGQRLRCAGWPCASSGRAAGSPSHARSRSPDSSTGSRLRSPPVPPRTCGTGR